MKTNSNKAMRRSKSTESLRASASSVPPLRVPVPPSEEEEEEGGDVAAAAVRLSRSKRMMARLAPSSTRVRVHAHNKDKLDVLRALRVRRLRLRLLRPRLVYLHLLRLPAGDKLLRARKPRRIKRRYDIFLRIDWYPPPPFFFCFIVPFFWCLGFFFLRFPDQVTLAWRTLGPLSLRSRRTLIFLSCSWPASCVARSCCRYHIRTNFSNFHLHVSEHDPVLPKVCIEMACASIHKYTE
jgi:hypothetical protein